MKLKLTKVTEGLVVSLEGMIEDGIAGALSSALPAGPLPCVVLDCRGVTGLNSIGAAQLHTILKDLRRSGQVRIRACRIPIVDYANALPTFLAAAEIESMEVPLFCTVCRKPHAPIVTAAEIRARAFEPPPTPCPSCGKPLGLDLACDEYFLCLQR